MRSMRMHRSYRRNPFVKARYRMIKKGKSHNSNAIRAKPRCSKRVVSEARTLIRLLDTALTTEVDSEMTDDAPPPLPPNEHLFLRHA
jgi:hypothetical protein